MQVRLVIRGNRGALLTDARTSTEGSIRDHRSIRSSRPQTSRRVEEVPRPRTADQGTPESEDATMSTAIILFVTYVLGCVIVSLTGRGVRVPGISFFEVSHPTNRASRRAKR
jgi:hypothetical protein